jgi:hypothetical protein
VNEAVADILPADVETRKGAFGKSATTAIVFVICEAAANAVVPAELAATSQEPTFFTVTTPEALTSHALFVVFRPVVYDNTAVDSVEEASTINAVSPYVFCSIAVVATANVRV